MNAFQDSVVMENVHILSQALNPGDILLISKEMRSMMLKGIKTVVNELHAHLRKICSVCEPRMTS